MFSQLNSQERKRFLTVLVIVLFAVGVWLLAGPKGVFRYYGLQQEIDAVKTESTNLKKQNDSLAEEIRRLEKDPAHIEDVARKEYGLVRKNEMIFDFSKSGKKH